MKAERLGRTTNRFTENEIYDVVDIYNGKPAVVDRQGIRTSVQWSSNAWMLLGVTDEDLKQLRPEYHKLVKTTTGPAWMPGITKTTTGPAWMQGREGARREREARQIRDKEYLDSLAPKLIKPLEAPTMTDLNIEKVILINGKRADEGSTASYLKMIKEQQDALAALDGYNIAGSKAVAKIRAKHINNIKNLTILMDRYYSEEV